MCISQTISVSLVLHLFLCAECLALQPSISDSAHFHLKKALGCVELEDVEGAIGECQLALSLDPKCAEAHVRLAELYMKKGTLMGRIQAERHVRQALKLDTKNADYHVTYGILKLKQGFVHGARSEFKRALELNPQCAEAYFNLGKICEGEVWHFRDMVDGPIRFEHFAQKDERKSIDYFNKALEIDPNHRDALFHLGLAYCEGGMYDEMAELYRRILKKNPKDKDARLFLGLANYRLRREVEARDAFEEAKQTMHEDERAIFESIETLLSPQERKQYTTAALLERDRLKDRFWTERDPLYLTENNERILEHYGRVAYANLRYGSPERGIPGWQTDQGKVYIRYGPPKSRLRTRPSIEPAAKDPVQTSVEIWSYENFDHYFEDMMLTGQYRFKWGERPESDGLYQYTALIKEVPQTFEYDYGGELFNIPCFLADFRGDGGKTDVDVCYALPAQYLDYSVEEDESRVFTEVGTFFFDSTWGSVLKNIADQELVTDRIDPTKEYDIAAQRTVQLEPGLYHFALEVRDKGSENIGLLRDTVEVKGYGFEKLQISDILFASDIEPPADERASGRGDFRIAPNPRKRYSTSQSVFIYYEIYNLKQDEFGQTHYEIEYTVGPESEEKGRLSKLIGGIGDLIGARRRKGYISATSETKGMTYTEHNYLRIDISDVPPDATMLTLTVRDLNGNEEATVEDWFMILE